MKLYQKWALNATSQVKVVLSSREKKKNKIQQSIVTRTSLSALTALTYTTNPNPNTSTSTSSNTSTNTNTNTVSSVCVPFYKEDVDESKGPLGTCLSLSLSLSLSLWMYIVCVEIVSGVLL